MSEKSPTKIQKLLVTLSRFLPELAALVAFFLGLQFVVKRLLELARGQ